MFTCSICGEITRFVQDFRKHINSDHLMEFRGGLMKCGQQGCTRVYSKMNSFGKHLYSVHVSSFGHSSLSAEGSFKNVDICTTSEIAIEHEELSSSHSFKCSKANIIEESLSELSALMYSNPQIPRNVVQTAVESIIGFTRSYNKALFAALNKVDINMHSIREALSRFEPSILSLDSEYKRFKYFEQKGTLILPNEILLSTLCEFNNVNGYHSVSYSMQIIPLNLVLQKFFSQGSILEETLMYVRSINLNSPEITNIMQGKVWGDKLQKLVSSDKEINLPIIVFYDDFEINNPLGSHAGIHKIGGLYISLPFLPLKLVSHVENIFVLAFFHTSDRVKFGNKVVFKKCIEELNTLSDRGIPVNSNLFKGVLKLHVVALSGDNLGINGMLGLVESFQANYYCRICKCNKTEVQSLFRESVSKLRTIRSYCDDLALNDPSQTGIKSECAWFQLNDFNLFDNVSVDLLHDYLEGCCRYAMDFLLRYLVQDIKVITLGTLESKLARFDYGPDSGSKPNNAIVVEGSKIRFKTSASEMKILVMYFGLIVGSNVPENNSVWEVYILLRQILDKLFSQKISRAKIDLLAHLIEEFLRKFTEVTQMNIKPKFHFLVHYPQMFLKFGPLTQIWTMRFEAKHQVSKIAARASKNRLNITKTLALRNQLSLNYRFMKGVGTIFFETGKKTPLDFKSSVGCMISTKYNGKINFDLLSTIPWFLLNGIKLGVSDVITVDICPISCSPSFGKIKSIIVDTSSEDIYLECELFETHYFDEHYHAYFVSCPSIKELVIINKNRIFTLIPNTLTTLPGCLNFITLRFNID